MSRDIAATEKAFIGALLRSPESYWRVAEIVTADMLTIPHHRDIYVGIGEIVGGGRKCTQVTLEERLPEEWDGVGPREAVIQVLLASGEDAGSPLDYADTIAERAAQERLRKLAEELKKKIGQGTAEDIAAAIATKLQEIMASATPLRPVKLSDAVKPVASFSASAQQRDIMPGFTTGLAGLDELIGLIMGGDFIGVIGALGDGKSALITQIGKHIARSGPVLSCHNEMSEEQNATRALAGEAGMSVRQIREGAYDFSGAEAVRQAQTNLEALHYYLYTDPRMTVRAIRARAIQMKQSTGLSAVSIDGLKRLRTDTRHRDRWDRLEEITGELKALAIELRVPVLLAVQRTRSARRRDDPIPQLDDADAPTLETDADIVLGVWREESWLMMNKPNPKAGGEAQDEWEGKVRRARGRGNIIALKVRSGQPFERREFKWNGPATRFEDS